MTTIRWGIIGCGDVTEVKSGPGFQKANNSALVAVMRRNGDLAADYAQRHGVPRWYDNGQALIDDPDVDAVYVATPPDAHKACTLAAAQAGKPVYVEKPMALNFAECQEMVEACRAAGVPLWVAYYRRRLPKFLQIAELLNTGAIGEPRAVNITFLRPAGIWDTDNLPWRVRPEIAGGGLFLDLGSHMLDFLDYALGPIERAAGHAGNQAGLYPAEDTVSGSFVFESGVQGTGLWCFCAHRALDYTEILGTRGKLAYATFDAESIVLTTADGARQIPVSQPEHVQQPLIQSIVDELNGQGRCPSRGESGARATWVMDQMIQGYYRSTGNGEAA